MMHTLVPERFSTYLVLTPRSVKQTLMLAADAVLLVFTVWAAYSLRFGAWFVPNRSQMLLMATASVLAMAVFLKLGLYRSVIRYFGEQAL